MNKRLLQFITAENISQSQFADNIGVARASVSHIIAGRNKPGFDFVEKMARAFPALNIEWLITGRGKMYKSALGEQPQKPSTNDDYANDLFGEAYRDSLIATIGNIGLIMLLAITMVIFFIYITSKTIEVIRKMMHVEKPLKDMAEILITRKCVLCTYHWDRLKSWIPS